MSITPNLKNSFLESVSKDTNFPPIPSVFPAENVQKSLQEPAGDVHNFYAFAIGFLIASASKQQLGVGIAYLQQRLHFSSEGCFCRYVIAHLYVYFLAAFHRHEVIGLSVKIDAISFETEWENVYLDMTASEKRCQITAHDVQSFGLLQSIPLIWE